MRPQVGSDNRRCLWLLLSPRRALQKAEIAKPIDEAELPGAKWRIRCVGQAAGHVAAVAQRLAGMAAIGINVHLEVRHAERQHRSKIFVGPDGMNLVIRTGRRDERRRNVARDGRRNTIAGEGRGAGIDDAHEVRARRDARQGIPGALFFLSKSSYSTAAAVANSAPAEKPMMPILLGSMWQSFA